MERSSLRLGVQTNAFSSTPETERPRVFRIEFDDGEVLCECRHELDAKMIARLVSREMELPLSVRS